MIYQPGLVGEVGQHCSDPVQQAFLAFSAFSVRTSKDLPKACSLLVSDSSVQMDGLENLSMVVGSLQS